MLGSQFIAYGPGHSGSLFSAPNVFSDKQRDDMLKFLRANSRLLPSLGLTLDTLEQALADDGHRGVFDQLQAEDKKAFNSQYGFDHYANPKLGQAYVMFPAEGRPGFGVTQCPYHFGYVLMESGGDRVTLEQFTGQTETQWRFEMYQSSNPGKDFQHKRNASFGNFGITTIAYKG